MLPQNHNTSPHAVEMASPEISDEQLRYYLRRGREMRSEAFFDSFRFVGWALAWPVRKIIALVSGRIAKRRLENARPLAG